MHALVSLAVQERGVTYARARRALAADDAAFRQLVRRARAARQLLPAGAVVLATPAVVLDPLQHRVVRRLQRHGWATLERLAVCLGEDLTDVQHAVEGLRRSGVVHPARVLWPRRLP